MSDPITSPVKRFVGQRVIVLGGATEWMKSRGYWIDGWPESIDGMEFSIVADYTSLPGDDSHYWIENDIVKDCGVHPMFLSENQGAHQ